MWVFWFTFFMNYFIMYFNRMGIVKVPISALMEVLYIILIIIALITQERTQYRKLYTYLLLFLLLWCLFVTLEMFNDTCNLGFNIERWYMGARLLAFQMLYFYVMMILYINDSEKLDKYFKVWAYFSIFAAIYCWKQKTYGFTNFEQAWFDSIGKRTHFVSGITRYWSIFNDAATFGCNMAASAALFLSLGVFSKLRNRKILYLATGALCVWAFFASGTRTAIVAFAAGVALFILLSKNAKIAIPVILLALAFFFILVFTNIGQGNNQIRRMRSAFNKEDASMGVREYNKMQLKKYLRDAPWGLGVGMDYGSVPPFNKYVVASQVPPDSEYVYIWVHTGKVGITVFVIIQLLILICGSWIALFKLKNNTLRGMAIGICAAFAAIQVAAYANQILMQYPNCFLFYGSMALVYILPTFEKKYELYEDELYQKYLIKKEEKARKKRESKVRH